MMITTTYDPAGDPLTISTQVTDILTGEVKTVGVSYGYDSMGNVISYTDELGNKTYYEYDLMNQLIKVTNGEGNTQAEYTYDCMGRILQEKTSDGILTTYTYDV
ncbi:MAG: RHS repeat protein, partial [Lachnospiraceae bacterium]|nr:RHS repeat protein [Lachnospiraceae bacterium]